MPKFFLLVPSVAFLPPRVLLLLSLVVFFAAPGSVAYFYGRHSANPVIAFLSKAFLGFPLFLLFLFLVRYLRGQDLLLGLPFVNIYRYWGPEEALQGLEELLLQHNLYLPIDERNQGVEQTLSLFYRRTQILLHYLHLILQKKDLQSRKT